MLGTYQHSNLRIEVKASASRLGDCLLRPDRFQQWLSPQRFSPNLPDRLYPNYTYTSWFGVIPIQHHVQVVEADRLQLLLSKGIDGFHEWTWGDGWIQGRLEGVSLLPLNLGQSYSLLRLQQFL
jgi:hypothetical protein